jgi:hypothetical protein
MIEFAFEFAKDYPLDIELSGEVRASRHIERDFSCGLVRILECQPIPWTGRRQTQDGEISDPVQPTPTLTTSSRSSSLSPLECHLQNDCFAFSVRCVCEMVKMEMRRKRDVRL